MSDILGGPLLHKEEVIWALQKLKVKDSAGKDGLRAEMANREMLVGAVQSVLVQWNGFISLEKYSAVVPVPKKNSKGACRTTEFNFWDISGVSGVQSNVYNCTRKALEGCSRKACNY